MGFTGNKQARSVSPLGQVEMNTLGKIKQGARAWGDEQRHGGLQAEARTLAGFLGSHGL